MDGGLNDNGVPRRISWDTRGGPSCQHGGLRRVFQIYLLVLVEIVGN